MVQYSNFDRVVEARDHFKNGASSSLTSRENFKFAQLFSKLSKIAIVTIISMSISGIVNAQTKQHTQQRKQKKQSETISDSEIRRLIPNLDALMVVQVDGKYGVRRNKPRPWEREYVIEPQFDKEPIFYGSNPGNTYIKDFNISGYYELYDKFGFVIFQGNEILPVYVQDSEEVAFFIIRCFDEVTYDLYECPETYDLIEQGDFRSRTLSPHVEKRLRNCRSITSKEDGMLECVKSDGSIELIPIRKRKI